MRGPFASLLRVPENGFRWRDDLVALDGQGVGENITGPWLIRSDSLYVRQYSPLAVSNLHRRFARTELTSESILAFSNEYGQLGHGLWLDIPDSNDRETVVGESLGFWQKEIERMSRFVDLWDFVRRRSLRELSQLVQWTPLGNPQHVRLNLVAVDGKLRPDLVQCMRQNPGEFRDHLRQDEYLAGRHIYWEVRVLAHEEKGSDLELLERWKHGDPIEPARYFVHQEVNNRLRGHVSPAVLPFRKGEIFFFPDCLLSSLYTQFMLELSGRSRAAMLCARPGCGLYFEPAHGRQRYCDKQCQQLAYYYRKKDKGQTN